MSGRTPDLVDFFDNAALALHVVGPDGTILRANQAELDLLGYTAAEYVGQDIRRFHADAETIADILRRLAAGETIRGYPARLRHKDGTIRHVRIDSSARFEDGGLVNTRCFTRDVTAEVEAGRRADRAQRHLAFLARASSALSASLDYEVTLQDLARLLVPEVADWCGIHTVEADGTIRLAAMAHADPAREAFAREWLGRHPISPQARYGVPVVIRTGETVFRPQVADEMLQRAARTPEELAALRQLGITSAIIVPLAGRGRTLGTITVFTAGSRRVYDGDDLALLEALAWRAALAVDNARLFTQEQQARAAAEAANRLKDDFLAVLSHELRTPLTSAYGWVRLLQSQPLTPAERQKAVDVIGRSVDMQLRLINDLLDLSAVSAGKIQLECHPLDLGDVVESELETFRATAAAGGLQATATIERPVPVHADPLRLRQVVSNLLSNALKFTPPGGLVDIRVAAAGGRARLVVADTGSGIEPDFLPHVFDRFRQADALPTRRVGGLGLGLALVRSFVELHGGEVRAESAGVGKGARFTVTLPLAPGPGDAARPPAPGRADAV